MNGRAYPDTLEPNGVRDATGQFYAQSSSGIDPLTGNAVLTTIGDLDAPESRLFSNPLSSLVQCKPGERILIRFANLGFLDHTIVFPGLEIDVLGRDARYVPATAQRKATDSIQVGPGESRDVFFTAPAVGTYAFYDRGMSHYTGSADGSNSWVGGQRSEIHVIANLADQLKPSGWAGEPAWQGEFPVAGTHAAPQVAATGSRVTTGPFGGRGKFIGGTVTVDYANNPDTYLGSLWWVRSNSPPLPGANAWNSIAFTSGQPDTFNIRVAGPNPAATSRYWVLAQDSAGVYSTPVLVQI
jgi:hypothetical protein